MQVVRVEPIEFIPPVSFDRVIKSSPRRSGGWHMKAVLVAMGEEAGQLEPWEKPATGWSPEVLEGGDDRGTPVWAAMGLAWEDWILPRLNPQGITPGELYYDFPCGERIYFTLDMCSVVTDWPGMEGKKVKVVEECKCTWRSCGVGGTKPIEDWWLGITQSKAYCMGMGIYRARMVVGYVNGEYEKFVVGKPKFYRYWIEFSKSDLDMLEGVLDRWLRERLALRRAVQVGLVGGARSLRTSSPLKKKR